MDTAYKLPPRFIEDCIECGVEVGGYEGGYLYAIDRELVELRNRAEFYADPNGPDSCGDGGALKRAAKALLKAMDKMGLGLSVPA